MTGVPAGATLLGDLEGRAWGEGNLSSSAGSVGCQIEGGVRAGTWIPGVHHFAAVLGSFFLEGVL